jgi:hypothetical protein
VSIRVQASNSHVLGLRQRTRPHAEQVPVVVLPAAGLSSQVQPAQATAVAVPYRVVCVTVVTAGAGQVRSSASLSTPPRRDRRPTVLAERAIALIEIAQQPRSHRPVRAEPGCPVPHPWPASYLA